MPHALFVTCCLDFNCDMPHGLFVTCCLDFNCDMPHGLFQACTVQHLPFNTITKFCYDFLVVYNVHSTLHTQLHLSKLAKIHLMLVDAG